jgi:cation transport ATPase
MSLCCICVRAGPGRDIIASGWQALSAGRPDMNSLVGLGATASFAVSCVAAALPALRWKTFFEEPAMLLGGFCSQDSKVQQSGTESHPQS